MSRGTLPKPSDRCRYTPDRPASLRLRIDRVAEDRLVRLLDSSSDVEVGCLLVGTIDGGLVEVTDIVVSNGQGTVGLFRFDMARDLKVAEAFRDMPSGEIVGEAHSHPIQPGDVTGIPEPSSGENGDLDKWASTRAAMGLDRWVCIILSATEDGSWSVHPFLVTASASRDLCQPLAA